MTSRNFNLMIVVFYVINGRQTEKDGPLTYKIRKIGNKCVCHEMRACQLLMFLKCAFIIVVLMMQA